MAVRLLATLLALGSLHVLPQLAQWRHDTVFRRWVAQLDDVEGKARVWLVLLPPVVLCLLLGGLLSVMPLGALGLLLLDWLVLVYAFGPREFEVDLERILSAGDPASREAAAQALADPGRHLEWNAQALGEAVALAALRRRFGVLLWFFLLGPAGALLYRLGQGLGRDDSLGLEADARTHARHVANALDWLPAQLLVFTLALVGHWEAVMDAWRRWYRTAAANSWYLRGPGFLAAAACADIDSEIEAGDGYAQDYSDPLLELVRMRSALLRALLAWLSVIALVVLGGWLH